MRTQKNTRILIECAMMISLATVLSIFKLVDMPYGGSVTIASALPMIILAYRHGLLWGLGSGCAYAVIQQLLGLNTLGYVTGWQSVVAVILLDYIVAFTVVGLGGVFKKVAGQKDALLYGALLVTVIRYICHVISGATVWAGLSIPTQAVLVYSLGYNATYMIPEGIILCSVAYYLGTVMDFGRDIPTRIVVPAEQKEPFLYKLLSGASLLVGTLIDVWLIAPNLQDEETGKFIISGLMNVEWLSVAIVSFVALGFFTFFLVYGKKKVK